MIFGHREMRLAGAYELDEDSNYPDTNLLELTVFSSIHLFGNLELRITRQQGNYARVIALQF